MRVNVYKNQCGGHVNEGGVESGIGVGGAVEFTWIEAVVQHPRRSGHATLGSPGQGHPVSLRPQI